MSTSQTPLIVDEKPKHRLNSYLFYLIYLVIFLYFCVYWRTFELKRSQEWIQRAPYIRHLEDGWIPGRKIDLSDAQYRSFRPFFPYLIILIFVYTAFTNWFKQKFCTTSKTPVLYLYSISSILILYLCFGNYLIFPLGITLVSFTSFFNTKD